MSLNTQKCSVCEKTSTVLDTCYFIANVFYCEKCFQEKEEYQKYEANKTSEKNKKILTYMEEKNPKIDRKR